MRQSTLNHLGSGSTFSVSNSYLNDDGSQSNTYSSKYGVERDQPGLHADKPPPSRYRSTVRRPTGKAATSATVRRRTSAATTSQARRDAPSQRKSIAPHRRNQRCRTRPQLPLQLDPLLRLTNDQAALQAKVNEMKADGGNNILEGVMCAAQPHALAERTLRRRAQHNWESGRIKNRKIIVVMTDG